MIWGETGTRQGATRLQLATVGRLWSVYPITELHDGDCIGVDSQLYDLAGAFGVRRVLHPPAKNTFRAFRGKSGGVLLDTHNTEILSEYDYYTRDRHIVNASQAMVACPLEALPDEAWESAKGGTWYTINYSLRVKLPLVIVWPNGHITYRNWDLGKL